jgi:hypothetical protein
MLQVVMQFQILGSAWSETHYYNADDAAVLINNSGQPTPPLQALVSARQALLPYQPLTVGLGLNADPTQAQLRQIQANNLAINPRLLRVRVSVSDPGNFRRVRVWTLQPAQQYGTYPGQTRATNVGAVSAETWTRLELACQLVSNNNGHIFLGGVPEDCVLPPDLFAPTGAFSEALTNYATVLTSTPYLTRLRPYSGQFAGLVANATPPQPITQFSVAPNGTFAFCQSPLVPPATVPPTPPGGFQQVTVVIRARHPSQWNGVHRALYQVANPAAVPPIQANYAVGPSRGPLGDWAGEIAGSPLGTIQVQAPQFVAYIAIVPERLDHRPPGPPFARPHGRRKRAA